MYIVRFETTAVMRLDYRLSIVSIKFKTDLEMNIKATSCFVHV